MLKFDEKMAMVKEIEKVANMGTDTIDSGDPYKAIHKEFVKKCNQYIRAIAKEHDWQVITKSHPFCEYSCFIKKDDIFVYVHISDFRFWNYNKVLYRIAEHSQDFTGKSNHYCYLAHLEGSLMELFLERSIFRKKYNEIVER